MHLLFFFFPKKQFFYTFFLNYFEFSKKVIIFVASFRMLKALG